MGPILTDKHHLSWTYSPCFLVEKIIWFNHLCILSCLSLQFLLYFNHLSIKETLFTQEGNTELTFFIVTHKKDETWATRFMFWSIDWKWGTTENVLKRTGWNTCHYRVLKFYSMYEIQYIFKKKYSRKHDPRKIHNIFTFPQNSPTTNPIQSKNKR